MMMTSRFLRKHQTFLPEREFPTVLFNYQRGVPMERAKKDNTTCLYCDFGVGIECN